MKPAAPVTRTFRARPFSDSPDYPRSVSATVLVCPDYPGVSRSSEFDRPGDAPDVDDVAVAEVEAAVRLVRRADHDHIGLPKHLVERFERLVDDVRVCAQHVGAFELRELAELVAERRAWRVPLALERHPQDAERSSQQSVA